MKYLPGTLVRTRNRDWVVQPESSDNALRLRPIAGGESESAVLLPALEPVESSEFSPPNPAAYGNYNSAMLFQDALLLKLRSGAGAFRSFANIAVEPRAYQLVPLLMALRMQTIRLLIADDVGVGKTIEAALILREMLDRGEIRRCAVLCPPHLVEQWQEELRRFHIEAHALTSRSVSRLEKNVPFGMSFFDFYKFVIISFDYIKSETHRANFIAQAPEMLIVDEAHTCTRSSQGRQLRYELLQALCSEELPSKLKRHVVLLTATPHSGDVQGFYNLLALLKPEFKALSELDSLENENRSLRSLREELALHFVQRRRVDIEEWHDTSIFPRRKTTELTYKLSGKWGEFFDKVQDYCREIAENREDGNAPLAWYATLALLRCVSSSPAAAEKTLTARAQNSLINQIEEEETDAGDLEPCLTLQDNPRLQELVAIATSLRSDDSGDKDPKLKALERHISQLLKDEQKFRPVVFCRYIATAHYVKEHLQKSFPEHEVFVITGEFTPEEREEKIAEAGEFEKIILVATDCLSEGINLQEYFNAVCHYDLCWNPTKHEQREGRVDRFGQKSPEVRCSLIYGEDNPVDGFILNVILRKAETIKKELGVLVPTPQDMEKINGALIKAAVMKKRGEKRTGERITASLFGDDFLYEQEIIWKDAIELAGKRHTIFAQKPMRPELVMPELEKINGSIGGRHDVKRFIANACSRLGVPLQGKTGESKSALAWKNFTDVFGGGGERIRALAAANKLPHPLVMDFSYPPEDGAHFIHRSHPLVSTFADILVESAIEGADPALMSRCAAIVASVDVVTCLYLLRLRHQLIYTKGRSAPAHLVAEEVIMLCSKGRKNPVWTAEHSDIYPLLSLVPLENLAEPHIHIEAAIKMFNENKEKIDVFASQRAQELLKDHSRVREAVKASGKYEVEPCFPIDLMGVYALLPQIK